jgi:Carboxypeptidase regulatory-like domain/TonB dependent receptor
MRFFRSIQFLSAFLLVVVSTIAAHAQQTGITGRVTDLSGAAIADAGVKVNASTGASFSTKTNSSGAYEFPALSAGDYVVTVSHEGFSTVKRSVTMLIGQLVEVDVPMTVASTNQSVIVEANTLAVDTTSSQVGGNITPQDVATIPINGRNYMELATLVPGVRVNAITNDTPLGGANSGKFQIDLDGLQVTQDTADASFGQPRFSPDAISQFQIITNRFDATVGRSAGIYVNVQTKSGGNQIHGSAFGYFRNDAFNASDPIAQKVLPLSDQQYGGTFGGPIKKDKMWYFGSYEGEHQGSGINTISLLPGSSLQQFSQTLSTKEYLGRGDYQINPNNHVMLRGNGFTFDNNHVLTSGSADPSTAYLATRNYYSIMGDWNKVFGPKLVNDLRAGFSHFQWQNLPLYSSLQLGFGSVTVGGPYNYPQIFYQNVQQYRDDVYYLAGKHAFKLGGEYMFTKHTGFFQQNVRGTASACAGVTTAAQVALLFPNGTTDPSTWNYSGGTYNLNSVCSQGTFTLGSGNFNVNIPRNQIGFWIQDDWKIFTRLTLNLGVRYDNDIGVLNAGLKLNNGLLTPSHNDNHQFGPRIGFAYDPTGTGKTVVRGGAGMYFADIAANQVIDEQIFNGVTSVQDSVTGSSTSPLNLQNPFPSSVVVPRQAVQPLGPNVSTPYALQLSGGVQRELPLHTQITGDYVHTRVYHDWIRLNSNLLANPSNPEFNLSPSTKYVAGTQVICPTGGVTPDTVQGAFNVCAQAFTNINQFFTPNAAGSIYDALQLGVQQRVLHGASSGVAYTYSRYKDSSESPFYYPNKPFVNGINDEWANAQDDQRHTLTVNGDYQWKFGLSLSGLYHFGSGNAFPTYLSTTQPTGYVPSYNRTFASPPVQYQAAFGSKTCPQATGDAACTFVYNQAAHNFLDSTTGYYITQRDALYGRNIYRVDSRLQESHKITERYHVVVALEAFNLFNHSNFGTYNGLVNSPTYGQPQATTAAATGIPVEFRSRSLQFVGRFEF